MQRHDLLEVFEKMYLQESEVKEKITTRIQIVFTLILALTASSTYILRMLDFSELRKTAILIVILIITFLIPLLLSSFHATRAFWGNTFKQMPVATEIKGYCNALEKYNSEVDEARSDPSYNGEKIEIDDEIKSYLTDAFEECATNNAEINIARATMVHASFKWLLISLVPLGIAAAIFIAFDMDVSSPRKNYQVIDKYVGDQLGSLDKSLKLIINTLNEPKVASMKPTKPSEDGKNQDKGQQNSPQNSTPSVQTQPKLPERPGVRVTLEDNNGASVEVKHEP